jgi:hypothetical protein
MKLGLTQKAVLWLFERRIAAVSAFFAETKPYECIHFRSLEANVRIFQKTACFII